MHKRLEAYLTVNNISKSEFAEKIGVTRSSLSHILNGRNKPGYDFITGVIQNYPEIDIEWLLTGKGKSDAAKPAETPTEPIIQEEEDDDNRNLWTDAEEQEANPPQEPILPVADTTSAEKSHSQRANTPLFPAQPIDNQRTITKILVFYSDSTFEEFSPSSF